MTFLVCIKFFVLSWSFTGYLCVIGQTFSAIEKNKIKSWNRKMTQIKSNTTIDGTR